MSTYQVCTKIKIIHHNFLKELAEENDMNISKVVKKLIKDYLILQYEEKIDPDKKDDKLKVLIISRKNPLKKSITIKLGEELHTNYKKYCVEHHISMKKMTQRIIRDAYLKYKK